MPRGWFNLDNAPDHTVWGTEEPAFDLGLTRMQRLMAFGACIGLGFLISLMGAILFLTAQHSSFAVLFAVGSIISLAGTGFLIGFKRQMKLMFKPVRLWAAIVMLVSIALCIAFAFILNGSLCLIFVIIEYLAMMWYSLSYIPYARTAVKNFVGMA